MKPALSGLTGATGAAEYAEIKLSAGVEYASEEEATLDFDAVVEDPYGYSDGTGFTVPSGKGGVFLVTLFLLVQRSTPDAYITADLIKGGPSTNIATLRVRDTEGTGTISQVVRLTDGQTIEAYVYNADSDTTLFEHDFAGDAGCRLRIVRLGD